MNVYCPRCREINGWESRICEKCGAPLRGPDGETYERKLIWALHHPEAATALRAATLLGEKKATGPLMDVLNAPGRDPYLGAAAARALGAVGDPAVRPALAKALEHGPVVVRLAAVEALEALGPEEEAVQALEQALRDRSANVREAASRVLERWSDATLAPDRSSREARVSGSCGARRGVRRTVPPPRGRRELKAATRVTVFIGEDERYEGRPLFEVLVLAARERGLVVATVFKGFMGYSANSGVSTSKILRLAQNLPVVVEMIGEPEKVRGLLPFLSRAAGSGVIVCSDVTLERVGSE